MKFIMLLMIFILGLFIALPLSTTAADNTGPQTWSLNSKLVQSPSVYEMIKNYGSGDTGQTGLVSLNYLQKKYWVSDQKMLVDFTFPSGVWMLQLRTDSDWGIQGSQCKIEIGEWDGAFHSLTPAPQNISSSFNHDTKYLVFMLTQSASISMRKNTYVALKITNLDIDSHIIRTGEGVFNSYLRSPETGSNFFVVLPEIPAGFLLGIGLTGLIGFVYIKRSTWIKRIN